MFCTQCGQKLPPSSKFCSSCGASQSGGETQEAQVAAIQPNQRPVDDGRERILKEVHTHIAKTGPSAFIAQRRLIVTNRRVIYREGIIGKNEISIPLAKITDVRINYSMAGRVAGYGTIRIESAGSGITEIVAEDMADARGMRDAILNLIK